MLTAGVTHAPGTPGSAEVALINAGDYKVTYTVAGTEPSQFALFVNGNLVPGTIYPSGAGTQNTTGQVIATFAAGAVLTLRNHCSSCGGRPRNAHRRNGGNRQRLHLRREARVSPVIDPTQKGSDMPSINDAPRGSAAGRRWAVAGSLVAAGLAFTGCGTATTTPLTILNTEKVERAIDKSILAQRGKHADVSCPSGVHQKEGLFSRAPRS